jgi:cytochrome c-type biogenesis protein
LVRNLLFIAGFSAVFVTMGATVTSAGRFLFNYREIFQRVAGIIVIILGLHIAGILKIKFLYYQKGFRPPSWGGYLSPLFLGVAFGAGWTPCVGPILSSILILAGSSETVGRGIILLIFYSAGLGIPFLVSGLLINSFLLYFQRLRRYFSAISLVSGIFLVGVGIAIFTGYLMRLSFFP